LNARFVFFGTRLLIWQIAEWLLRIANQQVTR